MPNFHKQRLIKRIFKILFTLFIVAVNAILLWRVFFSTSLPSSIEHLHPNAPLASAYAQKGDALVLRYQNNYSTTYAENRMGYFSNSEAIFIPEANQVQVVVRYNNKTLKSLATDYGLTETPDKSLDWFDFTLVKTTDITPQDPNDNGLAETLVRERFHPTEVLRDESSLYTFYRLVFDGVSVDPNTDGVFLDAYYLGDVNYEQSAYGTLCLYDCRMKWEDSALDSTEKKALAAFSLQS